MLHLIAVASRTARTVAHMPLMKRKNSQSTALAAIDLTETKLTT